MKVGYKMANKHTQTDLKQMQSLPLEGKLRMTDFRINAWYEYCEGAVYVSFSGGKDSTALLDRAAKYCKEYGYTLTALFCDTGLEYPEVRTFTKEYIKFLENKYNILINFVERRPETTFKVLKKW